VSADPLGKRALFSPPAIDPAGDLDRDPAMGGAPPLGKHALFSAGPHRPGTVVLECSRCLSHSRMSVIEAGIRIAFISVWIPGKRYSRWMLCPECLRRTWCKVRWFG
jgi:hypothetical protein